MEGHALSRNETKLVIDVFAENISTEIGFTEPDYEIAKPCLGNLKRNDVKATVNHATAMEYARAHRHHKLDIKMIQDINSLIDPDTNSGWSMKDLESPFRKCPIRVTNSCIVRPYPQEISSLMLFLLASYHESTELPLIKIINLFYNFLFIHPFADGNGHTARLLMNMELYKHGYVGCDVPLEDRPVYMSHFDRCFYYFDYQSPYLFFFNRIRKLQLRNASGNME